MNVDLMITKKPETDVLVIGGEAAGVFFAISAKKDIAFGEVAYTELYSSPKHINAVIPTL